MTLWHFLHQFSIFIFFWTFTCTCIHVMPANRNVSRNGLSCRVLLHSTCVTWSLSVPASYSRILWKLFIYMRTVIYTVLKLSNSTSYNISFDSNCKFCHLLWQNSIDWILLIVQELHSFFQGNSLSYLLCVSDLRKSLSHKRHETYMTYYTRVIE